MEHARAANAEPEEIAKLEAMLGSDETDDTITIEVEPENADAVRLFLRLRTQWLYTTRTITTNGGSFTQSVKTGLNLAALPAVAQFLGIAPSAEALDGLCAIEDECRKIYGELAEAALRRV